MGRSCVCGVQLSPAQKQRLEVVSYWGTRGWHSATSWNLANTQLSALETMLSPIKDSTEVL